MTKKERKELKLEIKGRKIVCKKLQTALRSIHKKVDVIEQDREKRKRQVLEYRNEDELQDAYGWGFITEEEYETLRSALRNGVQVIDEETSAEEIALHIIQQWMGRMYREISSFEFDLLPPDKQVEIQQKNAEIRERRKCNNRRTKQ